MYRLLIVDDEPTIVEGLYELFSDSSRFALEVYKAYSGYEALNILDRKKMDIVLSDVKMPGMDGLQLLDIIRSKWPDSKLVLLTGYSEFEYVYKAIQYPNVSYLLKTEGYPNIIKVVEKCIFEIEKDLKDLELLNKAREQVKRVVPLLQKEMLTGLIDGEDWNYLQYRFDEFNIPLNSEMPVILIVGCFSMPAAHTQAPEKLHHQYAVQLAVERYLSPISTSISTVYKRSYLVWLIQPLNIRNMQYTGIESDESREHFLFAVKGALESAQAACKESMDSSLLFVIGSEPTQWNGIADKFVNLRSILNGRMGSDMEVLMIDKGFYNSESGQLFKMDKSMQQMQLQLRKLEALTVYLEQGRKEEFFIIFDDIEANLKEYAVINNSLACQAYYAISLFFLSYINRRGLEEKIPNSAGYNKLTQMDRLALPDDMFNFYRNLAVTIFEVEHNEYNAKSSAAVKYIQSYIPDNLDGNLSLTSLAEMVYFNPQYLSRLFRLITGVYLSDYINDLKLNRAKLLLADGSLKIHEVGSKLGYMSAPYFTRFFKRSTGVTPQEYRNSISNK